MVDALIVISVLAAVFTGWRQGVMSSVLSFIGIVAGLVIGMGLAPLAMRLTDSVALRLLLAVGVMILLVGIGHLAGSSLGARLRDRLRLRSAQRIDSLAGSVFQAVAALLVIWLVSIPLASGLTGAVGKGLRESKILGGIHSVAPEQLKALPGGVTSLLNQTGLPPLVAPIDGDRNVEVAAPRIEVEDKALVKQLRPSVIHVLGDADSCSRRLMGSGFVIQDDYVVTNAHVVAGTNLVNLDTATGIQQAEVVHYNPEVDIAVLHSENLQLPPLDWAPEPGVTGDDAIVMGFPQSGPFSATPARVRDRITIAGPDIYNMGRVERDAYTVRGSIQQGNSGGPLFNTEGQVLGMVFGAAVDDTDTGYALTADEVISHIGNVTQLTEPVHTGECVVRDVVSE